MIKRSSAQPVRKMRHQKTGNIRLRLIGGVQYSLYLSKPKPPQKPMRLPGHSFTHPVYRQNFQGMSGRHPSVCRSAGKARYNAEGSSPYLPDPIKRPERSSPPRRCPACAAVRHIPCEKSYNSSRYIFPQKSVPIAHQRSRFGSLWPSPHSNARTHNIKIHQNYRHIHNTSCLFPLSKQCKLRPVIAPAARPFAACS